MAPKVCAPQPLPLSEVNCKTSYFAGPNAPTLHLNEEDPAVDSVAYLLRCSPQIIGGPFTWYVGRVPRYQLAVRMKQHLAGTACDFTAANTPIVLEALYPAAHRSVEAYVFYSMMEKLPMAAIHHSRLGGWTQTRPKPSQLCSLLLQEQKRMLSDSCLTCGSHSHFCTDKKCPKWKKWPDSIPLHCDHCHATLDITALGQTRTRPPTHTPLADSARAKRTQGDSSEALAAPPRKAPRVCAPVAVGVQSPPEYARVLICSKEYTTMAWFLGKLAGESTRSAIVAKFESRAVEFRNGDHKTLAKAGFARTQRPRELLPGRTNLSAEWVDTECKAARPPHKPFQVRRGCTGRNILWRVEDLNTHFGR
jgi:hypothetical protein